MTDTQLFMVCLVVPIVFGLAVQGWLKSTVSRYMKVPASGGRAGAEVARAILDANGLSAVGVEQARGGPLSDHYDPRQRVVRLSQPVFEGRSVAAVAIAAHECGHAMQHARAYAPMTVRSAIVPATNLASRFWVVLLLAGFVLQITGLITVAVVLYACVVLFQFVTLPVEFNASKRGKAVVAELGFVAESEADGVSKVLTAAAMTYVAAALAAVAQLLYFVSILGRN
jgi:uncharacterized protein